MISAAATAVSDDDDDGNTSCRPHCHCLCFQDCWCCHWHHLQRYQVVRHLHYTQGPRGWGHGHCDGLVREMGEGSGEGTGVRGVSSISGVVRITGAAAMARDAGVSGRNQGCEPGPYDCLVPCGHVCYCGQEVKATSAYSSVASSPLAPRVEARTTDAASTVPPVLPPLVLQPTYLRQYSCVGLSGVLVAGAPWLRNLS